MVVKGRVEVGVRADAGLYLFFKECFFRVRVSVNHNPNPNPKTAFFKKKKRDPDPDPEPRVLLSPLPVGGQGSNPGSLNYGGG